MTGERAGARAAARGPVFGFQDFSPLLIIARRVTCQTQ